MPSSRAHGRGAPLPPVRDDDGPKTEGMHMPRSDPTFSGKDLIRFFNTNLETEERDEVIEEICQNADPSLIRLVLAEQATLFGLLSQVNRNLAVILRSPGSTAVIQDTQRIIVRVSEVLGSTRLILLQLIDL